jgi:GNAT superfamily N-acetyltransferase
VVCRQASVGRDRGNIPLDLDAVAEAAHEGGDTASGAWMVSQLAGPRSATPVAFVMLSWNVLPQPGRILGPWFLWKLLTDERYQHRGYGSEVVKRVARIVHEHGCAARFRPS